MAATKDEKADKPKTDGVITAVYKVNLHCPQCASEIKKPLMKMEGVHGVEVVTDKGEIKVKGVIDVIKIHKVIEKLSKKKVELISPQPVKITDKEKEKAAATQKKAKETKEQIVRTTSMKVHLHCDKCEQDLRKKLLKHKDIYSVKTDKKAQTVTVQGTMEPDKLLSYIRKKVHKHAEIVSSKPEKKEEKKENPKPEKKEEKKESEKKEEKKEADKKEEKKENPKAEGKKDDSKGGSTESSGKTEVVEFKQEEKVEAKSKEGNVPYFVHYVYAPQLFSDENPNACSII